MSDSNDDLINLMENIRTPKKKQVKSKTVEKQEIKIEKEVIEPEIIEIDDIDEITMINIDSPPPIMEPVLLDDDVKEEVEVESIVEVTSTTNNELVDNDPVGIKQLLAKFGKSVELIINNHESDRQQAEDAIKFFKGRVEASPGPQGMLPYVEGWVQSLKIKTEINTNAYKVLDSTAKLIAAGKQNDLIVNVGGVKSGGLDIEKLLSQKPSNENE